MESYKNKPREELLNICKQKFVNGRTYEELTLFLNRHDIDKDTQKYIFDELEKYEQYLKDNPLPKPKKKPLPLKPLNIVLGIALIALALSVLIMGNMRGNLYIMSLCIAIVGIVFICIEAVKVIINTSREK